jgi:hypothetical protein
MHKETSSRVSSIAARILNTHQVSVVTDPRPGIPFIEKRLYDDLLNDAKTLAASCMSQDETPGQEKPAGDFHSRLKDERADLDRRLTALNSYLMHNPGHPNPRHNAMLQKQAGLMSELLAVIDERLADIAISERSAPVEEIEEIDEDDGA